MSPTQNSLKLLRERGLKADIVEHWIPNTKRRKDLFGCIDIIAVGNGRTYGVQTTSRSNVAARLKKVKGSEAFKAMVEAGWVLLVHGWDKVGSEPRVREVELS